MDLKKAIVISVLFIPPLTPIGFIVVFGYLDLLIVAFLFGLVLKLFLWPFKRVWSGAHRVERFFHHGVAEIEDSPRKFAVVGLITGLIGFFLFPFSITGLASGGTENLVSVFIQLIFVLGIPAFVTLLLASLAYSASNKERSTVELPGLAAAGATAAGAAQTADQSYGVFRDLQTVAEEEEAAGFAEAMAAQLFEELGLTNAAEAVVAEGGLMAVLPYLLIALAVVFVLFAVQFVVFAGVFFLLLKPVVGLIGGSMANFFGVSGAYGSYFGNVAGDRLAGVGTTGPVEDAVGTVRHAKARVFCLLSGPSCLRQWRLNNTRRPGSDAVGESYGLKIDRFEVGQGKNLDVAYKNRDYRIPVSFTISNPRRGLKGINAYNVSYRIRVIDGDRGVDNPHCDTGWKAVDAFTIRKDASGKFEGNDIYPGTSASTGFLTVDELTLENCNMLQPAAGEFRKVKLDVKYDYFSQATLYFQAMSLQNLQSNPRIEKSLKKSKTADTPVKAAVNVNSPVLYDEDGLGSDAAQPFAVKATLNTNNYRVDYRVKDLKIEKSSQVKVSDAPDARCQFEKTEGDEMVLADSARKNIISGEIAGDEKVWFDSNRKPPLFGCIMELENPGEISPTGETLTMGVESNYTVALERIIKGFRLLNSQCGSQYNCPILVPLSEDTGEDSDDSSYDYLNRCTGVDAGNGCSIARPVEGGNSIFGDSINMEPVRQGDTAYIAGGAIAELKGRMGTTATYVAKKESIAEISGRQDWMDAGIGLDRERLESMERPVALILREERRQIRLESVRLEVCKGISQEKMDKKAQEWEKNNLNVETQAVIFMAPATKKC